MDVETNQEMNEEELRMSLNKIYGEELKTKVVSLVNSLIAENKLKPNDGLDIINELTELNNTTAELVASWIIIVNKYTTLETAYRAMKLRGR